MKNSKMKAMISTGYGGPEIFKLQEVEKPTPKENEVLIKIHAAPVTTAETMMRTGYPLIGRLFTGISKPKNEIGGVCFAGVIEAVGSGVRKFMVGDEVFGESLVKFGTYAEYICLDEEGTIFLKPENVSFEEASVVGDGHVTSFNFLKHVGGIKAGQKVLIIGASGSLGTSAVQLAKHFGAEVTGVCSAKNAELVRSLGADHVIDYKKEDFTKSGKNYDLIYDTIGASSFSKCKNSLTTHGTYMSPVLDFGLLGRMMFTSMFGKKKAKFSATGMSPVETIKSFSEEISRLMKENKLKSIISKRYTLEDIPNAHQFIDKGRKQGNVVVVHSH